MILTLETVVASESHTVPFHCWYLQPRVPSPSVFLKGHSISWTGIFQNLYVRS